MSDIIRSVVCVYEISVDGGDGSYGTIYSLTHEQYTGNRKMHAMSDVVCEKYANSFKMCNMCGGVNIINIILYKPHNGSDIVHMDASVKVEMRVVDSALDVIKRKYNTHQAEFAMMNAAYRSAVALKVLLERFLEIRITNYRLCSTTISL